MRAVRLDGEYADMMKRRFRKLIAWAPVHALFGAGHVAYLLADRLNLPLYGAYNWLMVTSSRLNTWADLTLWQPVEPGNP